MLEEIARERLALGSYSIQQKDAEWVLLDRYFRGDQDKPFAPPGVTDEYRSYQDMAVANWIELAAKTPVQRLSTERFRTGRGETADAAYWSDVWLANKMPAREGMIYRSMMVHGRGLVSCWPNEQDPSKPLIRPESIRNVHLEPDPEDVFRTLWSVKIVHRRENPSANVFIPYAWDKLRGTDIAWVYDDDSWMRFERPAIEASGAFVGGWQYADEGTHPLQGNPFTAFDYQQDEFGLGHSAIKQLIPAQDAINTIRFNTLLAMQFSAYRQRVFTGFDPVIRDSEGNAIVDADGKPQLRPLKIGVDRALIFPGEATKVFDLPESNLQNYIGVLGDFLTQFFALGQIPPQYLLSRMANISGDALAGAESTLTALRGDIGKMAQEGWIEVAAKAGRARKDAENKSPEVGWAQGETRSFAATIDAIVKLVSQNFPKEIAWQMIPGVTDIQLDAIKQAEEKEAQKALEALPDALAANAGAAVAGVDPTQQPSAPTSGAVPAE